MELWRVPRRLCADSTTQPLSCQKKHGFVKYGGVKLPDTTKSRANQSPSLVECRDICLGNCSEKTGKKNEGREEDPELPLFSPCAKVTATDNLAFNMKLGEGGFGSVYKEMNPKISDFGLARMFGGDQTEGVTRKVVET